MRALSGIAVPELETAVRVARERGRGDREHGRDAAARREGGKPLRARRLSSAWKLPFGVMTSTRSPGTAARARSADMRPPACTRMPIVSDSAPSGLTME